MKKGEVWVVMERGGERRLEARIDKASRAPSVIAAAIDNGSIVGGDHVFVVKVLRSGVIGPKVPKPRKPRLGLVVDDGG